MKKYSLYERRPAAGLVFEEGDKAGEIDIRLPQTGQSRPHPGKVSWMASSRSSSRESREQIRVKV